GSLSVNTSDPNNKRAVLTAKANMTDAATGATVQFGDQGTMELKMDDKGEPGANVDTYAITIWGNNNTLLYSSNWSGTITNEVPIDGGNIQVRSSTSAGLPTTTTLTSSLNPSSFGNSVTFTATVSPGSSTLPATGTVLFKDGATTLGTGSVSLVGTLYKATITTSSLTTGNHPITAVYSGDANFNQSSSAVLTQVVTAPATTRTVTSEVTMEVVPFNVKVFPNPSTDQFSLYL